MCVLLHQNAFDNYNNVLLEAMYTTAFFGFFRSGEITVQTHFQPNCHITCNNVKVVGNGVKIFVKNSKTDVFHKGVFITLYKNDTNVCPFQSLSKYMDMRGYQTADPGEPFFVDVYGKPITRAYFIDYLKITLDRLGYDSSKYNGHSFRIGATTSAASARMEDHLIKTLGRWSSDCYTRYIRTSESLIQDAQNSLSVSRNCNMSMF
jgi:hypothetical protein